MKRKYYIALFFILLALSAGIISYALIKKGQSKQCGDRQGSQCSVDLTKSVTPLSAVSPVDATSATPQANPYVYKNDQFGFEISLNSAWMGYTVKPTIPDGKAEATFEFQLPTKDKNIASGLAVPLTVKVYSKENFNELSKNIMLVRLAETTKYVYTYSTWNDSPSDLETITEKDISNVAASFKTF